MASERTFTGEAKKPGAARDPDVTVVTCALDGVLANRKQCPHIPYTPVEIAEEARRAYEAGAAAVHIHARNDDFMIFGSQKIGKIIKNSKLLGTPNRLLETSSKIMY